MMLLANVGPVFWSLTVVIVVSGIFVVSLRNILHCALSLVVCLSAAAGIFILLNAGFLAIAQVLIHVVALPILIIFAIMLTSNLASKAEPQVNRNARVALLACLVLAAVAASLIGETSVWMQGEERLPPI